MIRASTVRLWIADGRLLRQGTYVIAPHDADRLGGVSPPLYIG